MHSKVQLPDAVRNAHPLASYCRHRINWTLSSYSEGTPVFQWFKQPSRMLSESRFPLNLSGLLRETIS
jgi:hypothetical protein